jgi:hypothetical protein
MLGSGPLREAFASNSARPLVAQPPRMEAPPELSMRTLRHIVISAAMLVLLVVPASANAKGYQDVIRDCSQDGQIDGHYTQHQLDQARHHIPSDIDEYTSCRDAIATALARGRNGGGGTGAGNPPSNPALTTTAGATAYNQKDYASLKSDSKRKSPPRVNVGASDIAAGGGKSALLTNAAAANSIPPSVLGSLIAVGLLTLAGTMLLVMRRWPGVRRVALRLFRR